jgi:hypothetical protein
MPRWPLATRQLGVIEEELAVAGDYCRGTTRRRQSPSASVIACVCDAHTLRWLRLAREATIDAQGDGPIAALSTAHGSTCGPESSAYLTVDARTRGGATLIALVIECSLG